MRVLHVGAGGSTIPKPHFENFAPVTLDIDPRCEPDIVASMCDLSCVPDESFEAVYTAHTLEHIYPHQVRPCLWDFHRLLKPGGLLMVVVPNLEGVQATEDVLYHSPSGPISGLDMIYGHHAMIEESPYMAHKCGFVADTLRAAIESAGFEMVTVTPDNCFNLNALARKAGELKE